MGTIRGVRCVRGAGLFVIVVVIGVTAAVATAGQDNPPDRAADEKWFTGDEYLVLGEWEGPRSGLQRFDLLEDGTFVYSTDWESDDTTISSYTIRDGVLELRGEIFEGGSLKGRVSFDRYGGRPHLWLDRDYTRGLPFQTRFRRVSGTELEVAARAGIAKKDGKPRRANGRITLFEAVQSGLLYLGWSNDSADDPARFAARLVRQSAYRGRLHVTVEPGVVLRKQQKNQTNSVVIASIQAQPFGSQVPPPINQVHLGRGTGGWGGWKVVAYSIEPDRTIFEFAGKGWGGPCRTRFDSDFARLFAHAPSDRHDPYVEEAVLIIATIQGDPELMRLNIDYSGEALLAESVQKSVALVKQALNIVPADGAPVSPVVGLWTGDPADFNLAKKNKKMRTDYPLWAYIKRRMVVRNDSTFTMYWADPAVYPRIVAIDGTWEARGNRLICHVSADEVGKELGGLWRELRPFVKEVTNYQLVSPRRAKLKEAGTPFSMVKHPW